MKSAAPYSKPRARGSRAQYFLTLTWLPPAERQGKLESVLFEGGETRKRQHGRLSRSISIAFSQETDQLLALVRERSCLKRAGSRTKRR